MGILDDLKKQVEQERQAQESEADRMAALKRVYQEDLKPRLLSIYRYVFDLANQLKVLDWAVEAEYEIPGIGKVPGLIQEGYNVRIDDMENPKKVTLRFICRALEERCYPVKVDLAPKTEQFLVSQRTKYMDWPNRDPSGQILDIVIQARLQILTTLMFHADVANSKLVVVASNLEGVSVKRYEFAGKEIDDEWLDKVGQYVLRKVETIDKLYITEEERMALRANLAKQLERLSQEAQALALDDRAKEKTGILEKLFKGGS